MTAQRTEERCFVCEGTLGTVRDRVEIRVGSRSAVVEAERSQCKECGEAFYSPQQMDAAQRAAADMLRHQEGLLGPSAILAIRAKYHLTQVQLERLLSVGPKTVVRWERGTVFQNRATDELLRVIDVVPAAFAFLARKNGVAVELPPVQDKQSGSLLKFVIPQPVERRGDKTARGRSTKDIRIRERPIELDETSAVDALPAEALQ